MGQFGIRAFALTIAEDCRAVPAMTSRWNLSGRAQRASIGVAADADEVLEAAQEDLAVADRRRGVALLA